VGSWVEAHRKGEGKELGHPGVTGTLGWDIPQGLITVAVTG
jgi:hypothetical protein